MFDDAGLDVVVAGIRMAGFYNAGQDCTGACRIYVGPRIHDRLVADLGTAAGGLKVGDPRQEETELGPLISGSQQERVAGFVERARATSTWRW